MITRERWSRLRAGDYVLMDFGRVLRMEADGLRLGYVPAFYEHVIAVFAWRCKYRPMFIHHDYADLRLSVPDHNRSKDEKA